MIAIASLPETVYRREGTGSRTAFKGKERARGVKKFCILLHILGGSRGKGSGHLGGGGNETTLSWSMISSQAKKKKRSVEPRSSEPEEGGARLVAHGSPTRWPQKGGGRVGREKKMT